MSQRGFTAIIVGVIAVLIAIYASANHLLPGFHLNDLADNFLTVITPVIFILTTLNSWFDSIDQMITDGKLQPGQLQPLFSMSGFYVTILACLSGELQIFGLKVLDADTQATLVNLLLLGSTVLLRSFSDRAPTAARKPATQNGFTDPNLASGDHPVG